MVVAGVWCLAALAPHSAAGQGHDRGAVRQVITSGGWQLVGDLVVPASPEPVPAVLLLNQAAGDRTAYVELAGFLAERGVASLRLDLRGHGESVNLGRFVPGERRRDPMIWDAEQDVSAALAHLRALPGVDGDRLAVVGASYSGEEMAEAGRLGGYAQAYVALSPGSFGEASIRGMDASGASWLFVASREERFLKEITAAVLREGRSAEVVIVPGSGHGAGLLEGKPDLAERVAVWLADHLQRRPRNPR